MKLNLLLLLFLHSACINGPIPCTEKIADPKKVRLYWLNEFGNPYRNMAMLFAHDSKLTYVTNAGMYTVRYEPVGLYVENGEQLRPVKKVKGDYYNFGMKPQSAFLITKDFKAKVTDIDDPVLKSGNILYATQSSPMLVRFGRISPTLSRSKSAKVRNGVGVLKNGQVLFAVSDSPCTFQEFAQYFISKGCTEAMMLDGVVSCSATRATKDFCNIDYGPLIGVY